MSAEYTEEQTTALWRIYQATAALLMSAVRPPENPKPVGPVRVDHLVVVVQPDVFEWFEQTVSRLRLAVHRQEPDWKHLHLVARHGKVLLDNLWETCWVGPRQVQLPYVALETFRSVMAEIEWEDVEYERLLKPYPNDVIAALDRVDGLTAYASDDDETALLRTPPTSRGYVDGLSVVRVIQEEAGIGTLAQVPEGESVLGVLGNGYFRPALQRSSD